MELTKLLLGTERLAAAEILTVLVEREGDWMPQVEVADEAGVPNASASRAVTQLHEAGWLHEERQPRERRISVNTAHPAYALLLQALWIDRGVQRPASSHWVRSSSAHEADFGIEHHEIQERVPVELRKMPLSSRRGLPDDVADGPDWPSVRARVLELEDLRSRFWMHPTVRDAYYEWGDERDRDLSHRLQPLGGGVSHAARVLRAVSSRGARQQSCIGRATWAHAVFAVNADAQLCLDRSNYMAEAQLRGEARREARRRLRKAEDELRRAEVRGFGDVPKDLGQKFMQQLVDAVNAAEQQVVQATDNLDGYHHHGGMPRRSSVGTAGERLLAFQLRTLYKDLARVTNAMAGHGSFSTWSTKYPEALHRHPLVEPSNDE